MLIGYLLIAAVLVPAADGGTPRPFAERLSGLAGLQNVGRVAPDIYRGSAPTAAGLESLQKLGIKTVINLRHYHGSAEEAGCRRLGIDYRRVMLASSSAPNDRDVQRFLQLVTDPARRPIYFHCWRGKDRTGVMCAAYRMAIEGWTLRDALAEMQAFGFFSGWHKLHAYAQGLPKRLPEIWPGSVVVPPEGESK